MRIIKNSKQSMSYTLTQGVGQCRVNPSWFPLKMIDCLILELFRLNIGPHICDLCVPCVILADGTSLIISTQTTMQTQLNVAVDYASKRRLKYNSLNRCIIYFTSKRNRKNNCHWEHLSLRERRCAYRYHRQKHLRRDSNKLSMTCNYCHFAFMLQRTKNNKFHL